MRTIMTRSASEYWGRTWPADWAYTEGGQPVTWEEVKRQRRGAQQEHLARKRELEARRVVPAYICSFQVPGFIFGGWWCYVVTVEYGCDEGKACGGGNNFGHKGDIKWGPLAESIMKACPLGLLAMEDNWREWMIALARHRPRRNTRDPRPAGSLVGWYDREQGRFSMERLQ